MQLTLRGSTIPLLQSLLTFIATTTGILLVLNQPKRSRLFPFYSDASHKDPSRVILCSLENLAWFFTPFTATLEYLHHIQLLKHQSHTTSKHLYLPTTLLTKLPLLFSRFLTLHSLINLYYLCGLSIVIVYFITTNVPSRPQTFTLVHQLAASGLLFFYAAQATIKIYLANTFDNYRSNINIFRNPNSNISRWWDRYHRTIRQIIAATLWIITTWISVGFFGRLLLRKYGGRYAHVREMLVRMMALIIYVATTLCIIFMVIIAIDLRGMKVVVELKESRDDGSQNVGRDVDDDDNALEF